MAVMLSSVTAYLGAVDESLAQPDTFDRASLEPLWDSAAEDALTAWTGGLTDLRGLLDQRIDDLMGRLYWSLLIMGTLAGLSILLAFMTHRSIVRPLARLEDVANRVRSTKDYSHRVDYESKDEIGHLAAAFNEMLGELDQARSRELADRAEQAARKRLGVLLDASPAVIYCRVASGDYEPTFVSDGINRLFGCTPREYLDNPYLWRDRVHPDDVPRINAWVDKMFESDKRALEYRIRRPDGTYFWVNDEQYVVRDERASPSRSWAHGPTSPNARKPNTPANARGRGSISCSAPLLSWFTVSPRPAISGRHSSAPASGRCLATVRMNTSKMPISGEATSIPTICRRSKPSRSNCSSRASITPNIASARRTAPIAGSATSSISFATRKGAPSKSWAPGAISMRAKPPNRRSRPRRKS